MVTEDVTIEALEQSSWHPVFPVLFVSFSRRLISSPCGTISELRRPSARSQTKPKLILFSQDTPNRDSYFRRFPGNKVKPMSHNRNSVNPEYTHWDLAGTLPTAAAQERCVHCPQDRGWKAMLSKDALTTTVFHPCSKGCPPNPAPPASPPLRSCEKQSRVSGRWDELYLLSDWVLWVCPFGWLQPLIVGATVLYLWRFHFMEDTWTAVDWWFKVQCELLAESSLFSIILWLGQEISVFIMLPSEVRKYQLRCVSGGVLPVL